MVTLLWFYSADLIPELRRPEGADGLQVCPEIISPSARCEKYQTLEQSQDRINGLLVQYSGLEFSIHADLFTYFAAEAKARNDELPVPQLHFAIFDPQMYVAQSHVVLGSLKKEGV